MSTVSIVLATYNGIQFIQEQLDSLCNQTRLPDEVIICDDGSTDSTVEFVSKYILDHGLQETWKCIQNEYNKGYAKNFLDAALNATGDYIFFCDQDDIWDYEKIEKMSDILEKDISIELLCSNLELIYDGEGGRKWDKHDLDVMTNDGSIERPDFDFYNFFCQRSGCTMCVRHSFLHNVASYWTSGWAHDDFVWKLATIQNSCAIFQYCSLKRRMHENNASSMKVRSREWRINQIKEQKKQYEAYSNFAQTINSSSNKKEIIRKNQDCADLRIRMLEKRNPFLWIRLYWRYKDCYVRKQAIMLDLYLVFFSKYNGVN